MKDKKTLLLTSMICLLPIVMGVLLFDQMPAEIATHFDSNGVADDYSPKEFAVFGLPVLLAVFNVIAHAAIEYDPRGKNQSKVLVAISKWICPMVSIIMNPCMYLIAIGKTMPVVMITMLPVSVLFIVIGIYLPKCKRSYTIGIKLPWTLHDEENWNKTHKLAGILWIIGGILMLVFTLLQFYTPFLGILLLMVCIPSIYSFVLYKQRHCE